MTSTGLIPGTPPIYRPPNDKLEGGIADGSGGPGEMGAVVRRIMRILKPVRAPAREHEVRRVRSSASADWGR